MKTFVDILIGMNDFSAKPTILVAGIGNIFLGDDAFGSELARKLVDRTWPEGVRVVDFGIKGFDLAYALMDGYDVTILLDATPRGGEPGAIYTIEPDLSELEGLDPNVMAVETHGMNPMKVLAMVKSMGGSFNRILLVGCEPETLGSDEGQMGLSDCVTASLERAANVVEDLIAKISSEECAQVTH